MHERVVSFEPPLALFVPDNDTLLFYRKLSGFAVNNLKPGGVFYAEINEALGNEIVDFFKSAGFTDVQLRKDMQRKDRMIKGTRPL